jgi:hypothetical protein
MKKLGEYVTKEEAAAYLDNLSIRRIEELVKKHGWTKRLAKINGARRATSLILFEDLKAFKAAQSAPTITIGEPSKAVAKRETSGRGSGTPAVFEGLAQHLVKLSEFQAQLLDRLAPEKAAPEAHRFISVREAAKYLGLTGACIEKACKLGRLPFTWDGPESRRRRMVRIGDLNSFGSKEISQGAGN